MGSVRCLRMQASQLQVYEIMETRDELDVWLEIMDDELAKLSAELPDDMVSKLDFSTSSLDCIGVWLVQRFASYEESKTRPDLIKRVARYVGETIRRNLPSGVWDLDHDGDPVISAPGLVRDFPEALVVTCIDRRLPDYLQWQYQSYLRQLDESKQG